VLRYAGLRRALPRAIKYPCLPSLSGFRPDSWTVTCHVPSECLPSTTCPEVPSCSFRRSLHSTLLLAATSGVPLHFQPGPFDRDPTRCSPFPQLFFLCFCSVRPTRPGQAHPFVLLHLRTLRTEILHPRLFNVNPSPVTGTEASTQTRLCSYVQVQARMQADQPTLLNYRHTNQDDLGYQLPR